MQLRPVGGGRDLGAASLPAVHAPAPLRRAGSLVLVEGGGLVLLGVLYAGSGVLGQPEDRLATVLAGVLAVLAGLALLAAGRALRAGRSWAWSPAVLAQLFTVVVAIGLLQGRVWLVGGLLLLPAASVLYLLATPESRAAYRGGS